MHLLGRLSPIVLAVVVAAEPASAHGLDAGRITVEVVGSEVRIVATPRSTSFPGIDHGADGLFDLAEVRAHRAELRAAVDAALTLTDLEGLAPTCAPTDVSTPGSGYPGPVQPSDHVRATRLCRFAETPRGLLLRDAFAAEVPVVVQAHRRGGDASERVVISSDTPATLLAEAPLARLEVPTPEGAPSGRTTERILLGGAVLGAMGLLCRRVLDVRARNQRKEEASR